MAGTIKPSALNYTLKVYPELRGTADTQVEGVRASKKYGEHQIAFALLPEAIYTWNFRPSTGENGKYLFLPSRGKAAIIL